MNLFLDITTSAEFWRRCYPVNRAPKAPALSVSDDCAYEAREVEALRPSWATETFLAPIGGQLHIFVFSGEFRRRASLYITHIWSAPLPGGSFYDLGTGAFVAAPEFMFLAAASTLTKLQLIAFGCELCGCYSFDQETERGFRKREVPLTTVNRLDHYLATAGKCRGVAKAKAALRYVVEKSASPMETFDVMALCLPYRLGGYGLPAPSMNFKVPLDSRASRIAKRRNCYADICYPKERLDIEHHGKLDHSSEKDQASDRARVNALKEMKYEVIELTKDQVYDVFAFEYIILRIAKIMGKRLDKKKLGLTPARISFHHEMRAWNRSNGRLR